eukprot:6061276-Prymnesium_polylepis.1
MRGRCWPGHLISLSAVLPRREGQTSLSYKLAPTKRRNAGTVHQQSFRTDNLGTLTPVSLPSWQNAQK